MGGDDETIRTLDVRGMKCPMPVLRTRRELSAIPAGTVLRVLATDPKAPGDIARFCAETGQDVLGRSEDDGVFRVEIRRR